MARRSLPALLAFVALLSDLAGAHGFALLVLFGAIPAAFALMLECFGDRLHARCGTVPPVVAGAGLLLLVLSASLRSPAVVGGVPRLAVSAIVLCLLLYAGLAARALLVAARRSATRTAGAEETVEAERLAA